MQLINWLWIEDVLVRACEAEIEGFGREHPDEPFFAFCMEFDGITGGLDFSYGTRDTVEAAYVARRIEAEPEPVYYRSLELRPENWRYRGVPIRDESGHWERIAGQMERYRSALENDEDTEALEFLWLRFEYLAERTLRRLIERHAFRHLTREPEFIAFLANEHERMEELEDRLEKLYPRYRRATVELIALPRPGELWPEECQSMACAVSRQGVAAGSSWTPAAEPPETSLVRCTYCGEWCCDRCRDGHAHSTLFDRQPFFTADAA